MKITYIAETSLTNKSAYTHHVLKMCDAFCKKNDVQLILPYADNNLNLKKIKKNFLLTAKKNILVKSILNFKINNFLYRIIFGYKAAIYLKSNNSEIIISRSFITSFFLCFFKINHFLEIHSEFKGLTRFLMINLNYINSKYILKTILISKTLSRKFSIINKKNFLILHDAVDIKNFRYKKNSNKIKSVTYVGSFHEGKGIELILELAKNFKKLKFNIYGEPLRNIYGISKNVKIRGHINYKKVPYVLANSDILLLPSADVQYGRSRSVNVTNYNSPLKMFDYLAAGKIILSSKRDGICEVLKHNYNSIIVDKYDLKTWIKTTNDILNNKYNLPKLRRNSIITAEKHTWNKRVVKILKTNESLTC
jgi:glycosyltransferase involved in cell wall biosynthesis